MDVDRPGLAGVVVAPDLLEQLVAGEDLARVSDEEREQLERLRLDRDGDPVAQQPPAAEVRLDRPEIDDRGRLLDRDGLVGPPEERPDTRRQLAQENGLVT